MFSNKQLLWLLIPIIAEQLLNSLMGMVDSMMVSNVSPEAISAVSLVDSINILVQQAFAALATGGVIVCSTYIGQKRTESAKKAAGQVIMTSAFISAVIMVICMMFRMQLLHLIFGDVDMAVMNNAGIYFFFTILSFPGIALSNAGSAVYRAQGNTRLPMTIAIISNAFNIIGNAVLIFGFGMGVAGAAIATLASRIFSAVVILFMLHRPGQMLTVNHYMKMRPDKVEIKKILSMGIPNGIENSMFQFGKLAIQSTVSTMGTVAIAAQAMTNIFENVNGVAGVGVGIGLMTIVGQCMGAGRKDEAIYYVKKMLAWSHIAILSSCIFAYVISRPVTYFAGMEEESAKLCIYMLGWITVVKPILWPGSFTTAYGFRAAGDVRFPMIVSTISMWFCRVSLCMFLCRVIGMGPMGVWIGMFTDWGMRNLIFTIRFRSGRWLRHKVV
ncbi:MAG: MATE family efflux transporter [Butyrivibrio sp.]|nr:MATE family efflux transporter [Butyrivibrio sp.]